MSAQIKVLESGDEAVLATVLPGVFDNPVNPAYANDFLSDPRHHIAVAIDNGVVVGFASGVHYIHPDKPPELWVNEVSIAESHRKLGLGKAVLHALLDVGKNLGCESAWVLTYRDNSAANSLYLSLGGTEGADNSGPSDALVGYTFALGDSPKIERPK